MALTMIKNVNLALVFFLELAVLVALGYWGFSVGQGVLAKFGIGLGLPVVAIIVWGLLGAPKSQWQLQGIWYAILQVIFFGSAAVALYAAGQRTLGVVFALVCVVCCVLARVLV
jgi:hypothetical protein